MHGVGGLAGCVDADVGASGRVSVYRRLWEPCANFCLISRPVERENCRLPSRVDSTGSEEHEHRLFNAKSLVRVVALQLGRRRVALNGRPFARLGLGPLANDLRSQLSPAVAKVGSARLPLPVKPTCRSFSVTTSLA